MTDAIMEKLRASLSDWAAGYWDSWVQHFGSTEKLREFFDEFIFTEGDGTPDLSAYSIGYRLPKLISLTSNQIAARFGALLNDNVLYWTTTAALEEVYDRSNGYIVMLFEMAFKEKTVGLWTWLRDASTDDLFAAARLLDQGLRGRDVILAVENNIDVSLMHSIASTSSH
jgi:hypothetical protein